MVKCNGNSSLDCEVVGVSFLVRAMIEKRCLPELPLMFWYDLCEGCCSVEKRQRAGKKGIELASHGFLDLSDSLQ